MSGQLLICIVAFAAAFTAVLLVTPLRFPVRSGSYSGQTTKLLIDWLLAGLPAAILVAVATIFVTLGAITHLKYFLILMLVYGIICFGIFALTALAGMSSVCRTRFERLEAASPRMSS